MSEYRKEDLDSITDTNRYKLVYELGVSFDELDTSKHDAEVIADAIHKLENSTVNCHEDYEDGIHFAIGVLKV